MKSKNSGLETLTEVSVLYDYIIRLVDFVWLRLNFCIL